MDRFIVSNVNMIDKYYKFKIQYGQIYRSVVQQLTSQFKKNLKSNMDRFIDECKHRKHKLHIDLKSNMDRFIEFVREPFSIFSEYLKSNMDRFIAKNLTSVNINKKIFKIQYGQIYRQNLFVKLLR